RVIVDTEEVSGRSDGRHIARLYNVIRPAEHAQDRDEFFGILLVIERLQKYILPGAREKPRSHHIILAVGGWLDGGEIERDTDLRRAGRLCANRLRSQPMREQQVMGD